MKRITKNKKFNRYQLISKNISLIMPTHINTTTNKTFLNKNNPNNPALNANIQLTNRDYIFLHNNEPQNKTKKTKTKIDFKIKKYTSTNKLLSLYTPKSSKSNTHIYNTQNNATKHKCSHAIPMQACYN